MPFIEFLRGPGLGQPALQPLCLVSALSASAKAGKREGPKLSDAKTLFLESRSGFLNQNSRLSLTKNIFYCDCIDRKIDINMMS